MLAGVLQLNTAETLLYTVYAIPLHPVWFWAGAGTAVPAVLVDGSLHREP